MNKAYDKKYSSVQTWQKKLQLILMWVSGYDFMPLLAVFQQYCARGQRQRASYIDIYVKHDHDNIRPSLFQSSQTS